MRTVAVHSDIDANALHVTSCDVSVCVGEASPAASYLNIPAILAAAAATGSTMLHPGYGFLSENADFAEAVEAAGLIWVGPTPEAMRTLGGKLSAREHARSVNIPVLSGARVGDETGEPLVFPMLVKASAGGGGRGMRRVDRLEDLDDAIASAKAEALAAFGDDTVYTERLLAAPRHVEVQILGDGHGNVVVIGERECSIQRRHQKLIEEAPFDGLGDARHPLHDAARTLAASVRYRSAGTVEFLWDGHTAWFLEVNARLQVEHPVTELVYGVDLVRAQLRLALGAPLSQVVPHAPEPRGHAIECRILAEDPAQAYLPSPGTLGLVRWPQAPGVRVDTGVRAGDVVSTHYDALLAKIIVHAPDRECARMRMIRALDDTVVMGVATTVERLGDVLRSEAFATGAYSTETLSSPEAMPGAIPERPLDPAVVLAAAALATLQTANSEAGRTGASGGETALPSPWQTVPRWT